MVEARCVAHKDPDNPSWLKRQSLDMAPPAGPCAKSATPLADAKNMRASLCRDWYEVVWNKPLLTMLDTVAKAINWLSSTALCFFSADAMRTPAAAERKSQESCKILGKWNKFVLILYNFKSDSHGQGEEESSVKRSLEA